MLITGLLLSAGCKPTAPVQSQGQREAPEKHEDAHAEAGPHDGHLIELGEEEYHAELVHDDAAKSVTIYLLDSSAKSPVPIEEAQLTFNMVIEKKPVQFKLAASPQDNDPNGQSSRFVSTEEQLLEALDSHEASGRVNVNIQGKSYSGNVEHHHHGGEG